MSSFLSVVENLPGVGSAGGVEAGPRGSVLFTGCCLTSSCPPAVFRLLKSGQVTVGWGFFNGVVRYPSLAAFTAAWGVAPQWSSLP